MDSQSIVRDLEELTSAAFQMLERISLARIEDERLRYAAGLCKAMCMVAEAIVRVHPDSDYYADAGRSGYNPIATGILSRALIESWVDFHHLFLDAVPKEEAEFRLLVAQLHCERDRLRHMQLGEKEPAVPAPDELPPVPTAAAYRQVAESNERRLMQRLESNPYFRGLCPKTRARLLGGKHTPRDRYRQTGCQPQPGERARRAGLRRFVREELRSHLSAYVHVGPHAVNQVVWFIAVDAYARRAQVDTPVRIACGVMAMEVRAAPSVFPECRPVLTAPVRALILRHAQLVCEETGEPVACREPDALREPPEVQ